MKFSKMQAAGNDFVLINGLKYGNDLGKYAINLCDRHFGVGADGLLFCTKSEIADIRMNYYNSDGTRAAMCGNGIRCFTKFIYDNKIINKDMITIETDDGIKTLYLKLDENKNIISMSLNIGKVDFIPKNIPCTLGRLQTIDEKIEIDGEIIKFSACLMGVPHVMIEIDDFDKIDINDLGKKIENHQVFPKKTNVNFVKKIDDNTIQIKTWERGAGRTLGCGTGSAGVCALLYKMKKINNKIKVINDGGEINIEILDDFQIILSGLPKLSFVGEINI